MGTADPKKKHSTDSDGYRWNAFAISEEMEWNIGASAPKRITNCLLRLPRRRFRSGDVPAG